MKLNPNNLHLTFNMTLHDYTHEIINAVINTAKLDSLTRHKIVRKVHSMKSYRDFKHRKIEEVKLQTLKRMSRPLSYTNLPNSIKQVINIACEKHEIDLHEFCSNRRLSDIIDCQRQVIYLLHKEYHFSCTKVASWFIKDHSTILHSCKKHLDLMDTTKMYARLYGSIRDRVANESIFEV